MNKLPESVEMRNGNPFCKMCEKPLLLVSDFVEKLENYRLRFGPLREELVMKEIFSVDNACIHGGYDRVKMSFGSKGFEFESVATNEYSEKQDNFIINELRKLKSKGYNNELILGSILMHKKEMGNDDLTDDEIRKMFWDLINKLEFK